MLGSKKSEHAESTHLTEILLLLSSMSSISNASDLEDLLSFRPERENLGLLRMPLQGEFCEGSVTHLLLGVRRAWLSLCVGVVNSSLNETRPFACFDGDKQELEDRNKKKKYDITLEGCSLW